MLEPFHDRWRGAAVELAFADQMHAQLRGFLAAALKIGELVKRGQVDDGELLRAMARARLFHELVALQLGVPLDLEVTALLKDAALKAPEVAAILRAHGLLT